jgi:hypothetical protein
MLIGRLPGVAMSFNEDRKLDTSQVEDMRGEIDSGDPSGQI